MNQHVLTLHDQAAVLAVEFAEPIRLVIWDLDETFWRGTLTEGGIAYVDAHHNLVLDLAKRGIMSSICSKNDHDAIETVLKERGLWEYFIFPSIDWTPKAARIAAQIDEIGLRPPTVLFIDDNPQNLHQAAAHVPGLNIADPSIIPHLLDHPQLVGKDDAGLSRLSQYKNLEQKKSAQVGAGGDHIDFLRSSDVRIYFEHDVEKHIDRVIELINRTNQLNFTKKRLPEDPEQARNELLPFLRHPANTVGLVRVVDRFGDYGFVGFYAMSHVSWQFTLSHFCFSCRTINMYVEHFVYDFLGRPALDVVGDVISDVKTSTLAVDWIRALPSAELEAPSLGSGRQIKDMYVRGGCDLTTLIHYFTLHCSNICLEMNIIKNWQVLRLDHSSFLKYSLEGLTEEQMRAAESLGYDHHDFVTQFPTASFPELMLISFWADADIPLYRHRESGLELPYWLVGAQKEDLRTDTDLVARIADQPCHHERLARLREEWDYRYGMSHDEMVARYREILGRIPSSTRIFMTLANTKDSPYFDPPEGTTSADWIVKDHVLYNAAVNEAVQGFDNVDLIDFDGYVTRHRDAIDMNHLRRDLYFKIYQEMMDRL